MKNTFLYRVYTTSRPLFVVAVIAMLGTLLAAARRTEQFPFLLYGMYSTIEKNQDEYVVFSIEVNGQEVNYKNMKDAQQELVITSLGNVVSLNNNPPVNAKFANWLKGYIKEGEPLNIYKLTCSYSADGKPIIRKRELIYTDDKH